MIWPISHLQAAKAQVPSEVFSRLPYAEIGGQIYCPGKTQSFTNALVTDKLKAGKS